MSPVTVTTAVGVAALVTFVLVERRRNVAGKVVLLDLSLFAIPSLPNGPSSSASGSCWRSSVSRASARSSGSTRAGGPSRQIGSALGIAVLGTVLFTSLGTLLSNRIEGMPGVPAAQRDKLVSAVIDSAGAAISGLERSPATAAIASAARLAFTDAVRWAAFSAVVFLVLGFLTSLSLGRREGRHASGAHKEPQPASEDGPRVNR